MILKVGTLFHNSVSRLLSYLSTTKPTTPCSTRSRGPSQRILISFSFSWRQRNTRTSGIPWPEQ